MGDGSEWKLCPVLGVRDVRAAAEHFARHLGFSQASVFDGVAADEGAVYAILKRQGAEIHLQIRRRPLRGGERERIERDVYVRVRDADALHAELVERGAAILQAPEDAPYGMRDFTAEGPEGYRLTFGSPLR